MRSAIGRCCSSARREPCAFRGRRSRCGGCASVAGRAVHERSGGKAGMNILLDLDGTLTNPEQDIVGCIRHALDTLERTIPADVDLAYYIGPPLADTFRELLATDDPGKIDAAITAYRARFGTIGLFENEIYAGIPEALETLAARGARLFLATSKPRVYAARLVEHFGLAPFFTALHGSELDGTRTDKGDLIAHILEVEGLASAHTVMIGDRRH